MKGNNKQNIAIIGTGISGLTSAYLLSREHNVTVFEKNDYIGGHTATKDIHYDGRDYAIDTGFIVCNDRTYPHFFELLSQLGITLQPTEMSFSVVNKSTNLEYNGSDLNGLFSQRQNILKPQFWQMIQQILRFNKACKARYESDDISPNELLGDYLHEQGFSEHFCQNYILPMGAAIWSTSLQEMKAFQLRFFVRFFYHHGLLNISDRPQWYVVPGGSKQYIAPLIKSFVDNIKLSSDIKSVTRATDMVTIEFSDGNQAHFDQIIFACHSDEALALLGDATEKEQAILGAIPYSENEVVLHTDRNILPQHERTWASWNYLLNDDKYSQLTKPSCVTYNMNILQGIKSKHTFCVTLNQTHIIEPSKIIQKFVYHHPVFNQQSLAAQQQRDEICGRQRTHFVGAYWHNGFHEDGVKSAVIMAQRFGIEL